MTGLPEGPTAATVRTSRALSEVLAGLAAAPGEWISLGAIAAALSDRSHAALLILLSGPNLLPLPPGASTIFGLPLALIAAQLLYGQQQVWLPRAIRERALDQRTFAGITDRLGPWLQRLERVARPRCWPMPRIVADRLVGGLTLAMALLLILPIPFGNWLPALSIVLCSIGLSERDGLWLVAGVLAGAASVAIVGGVVRGAVALTAGLLT